MAGSAQAGPMGGITIGRERPYVLALWLFGITALILLMVVVGGITRLTESGLSITQWKPITGAIPPLSRADWQAEFDAYKHSSQYVLMNQGMTLSAFKQIYFWEYFHRLLGRLIGFAFAVPLLWFIVKRAVPKGFIGRLILLLMLGGAQGGIGWLMVRSGLTDRVNVEPAMLAAHLGMALLLMAAVIWTACDLMGRKVRPTLAGSVTLAMLFVQILLGAITAGLRAGQVANTWPMMNDRLIPDGIQWWGSLWRTLTSDPFLVHFLHRWWAWAVVLALALLAARLGRLGDRRLALLLVAAMATQAILGIATVLTGVALVLAVSHQLVGAALFGLAVAAVHRSGQVVITGRRP